jgi:hypothetical protein
MMNSSTVGVVIPSYSSSDSSPHAQNFPNCLVVLGSEMAPKGNLLPGSPGSQSDETLVAGEDDVCVM